MFPLLSVLRAPAVNSLVPFKHFDVSGIAETSKCRPVCLPLNVEPAFVCNDLNVWNDWNGLQYYGGTAGTSTFLRRVKLGN
jgi:hypothetical protein